MYVVSLDHNIGAKRGRACAPFLLPEVAARWHLRQPVLYIGQTQRHLRERLGEFYRHKHGNASPHSGGEDLLLLVQLGFWRLWVHWAQVDPTISRDCEDKMLRRFALGLPDVAEHRLPFANRRPPRRGE